jgi:type VI secretion system secreted protein Hcp
MASIDTHLKLSGIQGEATQADHKDEIELLSWSWGASNEAFITGGGSGKGKAQPQALSITKLTDKASPILIKQLAMGKHLDEAKLSCAKSGDGQKDFMTITLKEVFVTSYQVGGSSGADLVETVSLSFGDIEIEYKPQDAKGNLTGGVKSGWNIKDTKTR